MSGWKIMALPYGRTVRRIIEELAEHFNYEENYESRITAYITQLQKDGFVKLVIEN